MLASLYVTEHVLGIGALFLAVPVTVPPRPAPPRCPGAAPLSAGRARDQVFATKVILGEVSQPDAKNLQ